MSKSWILVAILLRWFGLRVDYFNGVQNIGLKGCLESHAFDYLKETLLSVSMSRYSEAASITNGLCDLER